MCRSRTLNARSRAPAPQIEAVYADIEAHIGSELKARFHATQDELIAVLVEPPEPDGD